MASFVFLSFFYLGIFVFCHCHVVYIVQRTDRGECPLAQQSDDLTIPPLPAASQFCDIFVCISLMSLYVVICPLTLPIYSICQVFCLCVIDAGRRSLDQWPEQPVLPSGLVLVFVLVFVFVFVFCILYLSDNVEHLTGPPHWPATVPCGQRSGNSCTDGWWATTVVNKMTRNHLPPHLYLPPPPFSPSLVQVIMATMVTS